MGISINNLNNNTKYNTASSLLNSLPQAASGEMENLTNTVLGNNSAISLTDYAAIKNGSYKTMLKAYVAKMESDDSDSEEGSNYSKKVAEESTPSYYRDATTKVASDSTASETTVSKLTTSAQSLAEDAEVLTKTGSGSVFSSLTGNDSSYSNSDYNMKEIASAVKSFADSYNSVLSQSSSSSNSKVTSAVSEMNQNAGNYEKLLNQAGITVADDGKLSVDESKVRSTNISTLKNLFNNSGSFASQTESYASQVKYYSASADANSSSSASGYSADGTYSNTTGLVNSLYNTYL